MTESKNRRILLIGLLFPLLAGTLLHFIYDWFPNPFTALFAAVNESVWEHSRLVSAPMLVAVIWEYPLCNNRKRFFFAKACGCWTGTLAVPTLFYTYSGIVGENVLWADILVFVLSVFAGFAVFRLLLQKEWTERATFRVLGGVLLFLLAGLDVCWTFAPPHIGLFQDPTNGQYGVF